MRNKELSNDADDPTQIAKNVAFKYSEKGFKLDFSFKSLVDEIDKILEGLGDLNCSFEVSLVSLEFSSSYFFLIKAPPKSSPKERTFKKTELASSTKLIQCFPYRLTHSPLNFLPHTQTRIIV